MRGDPHLKSPKEPSRRDGGARVDMNYYAFDHISCESIFHRIQIDKNTQEIALKAKDLVDPVALEAGSDPCIPKNELENHRKISIKLQVTAYNGYMA